MSERKCIGCLCYSCKVCPYENNEPDYYTEGNPNEIYFRVKRKKK